jgi:ABC-2 type transport system ATP-binding protein
MTDERPGEVTPNPQAAPAADANPAADADPAAGADPAADLAAVAARPPAPEASPSLVTMRGVSRRFDDRIVVRSIDLEVPAGTILGIIGPSGSGKTTTIRMLTGGLAPTEGEVEVLGERPRAFRRGTQERIGYMPQLFTLYPDLTVRENVDFVGSLFGMLWPRRRRRTKEVLKLLDLWDSRRKRANDLSGGMQRRLELACTLVHDPTLLILDEPTAGLDPLLRATVWEELHRLRDDGRTILVTTQYVNEAEECDAVALIAAGRLIAIAPPEELRRQAMHGEVIEIETARMFDASALEGEPRILGIRQLDINHFRITVDDAAAAMPAVVEAVGRAGVEVTSAKELQLSFDEVFAELIARAEAADTTASAETAEAAA